MDDKIDMNDQKTWPKIESVWRHHSGRLYRVIGFANVEQDRQDEYPTTIIYQNVTSGKKYAQKLNDWNRSMAIYVAAPSYPPSDLS